MDVFNIIYSNHLFYFLSYCRIIHCKWFARSLSFSIPRFTEKGTSTSGYSMLNAAVPNSSLLAIKCSISKKYHYLYHPVALRYLLPSSFSVVFI